MAKKKKVAKKVAKKGTKKVADKKAVTKKPVKGKKVKPRKKQSKMKLVPVEPVVDPDRAQKAHIRSKKAVQPAAKTGRKTNLRVDDDILE